MPIISGLITTARAGQPYYRITSITYQSRRPSEHKRIVNGEGAILSPQGARYNHPGVRTVYLAEEPATCLAEWMYYFHRGILTELDQYHIRGPFPAFQKPFILWEIRFRKDIPNLFELSLANASAMTV